MSESVGASPLPPVADVVIVGAGAAGLATAIFAAESAPTARIVLLEGARALGAKILVSGGGRCNVTHDVVTADDFNGVRPVVRNVLAAFGVAATVDWFASLGIALEREETGKLFPASNKAATVVTALVARCRALGVTLATGHRVADVTRDGADGALRVRYARGWSGAPADPIADPWTRLADLTTRLAARSTRAASSWRRADARCRRAAATVAGGRSSRASATP